MKNWIGPWLIAVSILHTLYGFAVFHEVLASILAGGVINAIGGNPRTASVVWFVLFGAVLFICGLLVQALQRTSTLPLPKSIGWSLLSLGVLGAALMPASGFWLIFPPAFAILAMRESAPDAA